MKTTKISNIVLLIVATTAIILHSCNLDLYPHNGVSPESVSDADIALLRVGMYNDVQSDVQRQTYVMGDILGGLIGSDVGSLPLINSTLNTLNSSVRGSWNGCFAALYQVNNVLGIVGDNIDSDIAARAKAEALFLRAYLYTYMVRSWGGVPILRTNGSTTDKPSRNTQAECWVFIEADLTEAELIFSSRNLAPVGINYVSLYAVKALKARVLIEQGKKTEAATVAEDLINNSRYRLDTFEKTFHSGASNEIIFSFPLINEESAISFGGAFCSYESPSAGSWVYRPTAELMELFDDNDNRKNVSIASYKAGVVSASGNAQVNKYLGGSTNNDPFVVFRLAEMYLISAEAQGFPAGMVRLNELREARGLAASTVSVSKYTSALVSEYKKEFVGEGHLYYDLKRLGVAVEEIGILEYQQLLPIPGLEIDANSNLTQNPGY